MKLADSIPREALRLRKKGLSYNEIRKHLPVAKSTLSLWLKHVRLSEKHRLRLYTKKISVLSLGSQSQKERRAREISEIIENAKKEIVLPIPPVAYQLMGAALYWAEGTKGNGFEITNSDPHLVLFMTHWIERVFKIPSKNLKARLNIYPQQNEIHVKKFWSDLTDIPLKNFGKSYIKPMNTGWKKNNLYFGTIKIAVPRGTDMRHRLFGWIQSVLGELGPKISATQRKWISLRKTVRPVNLQ